MDHPANCWGIIPGNNFNDFAAALGELGERMRNFPSVTMRMSLQVDYNIVRDRAQEMLLSHLDNEQRRSYEQSNTFQVKGSVTGDIYTVTTEQSYNVIRERDKVRLCVQPVSSSFTGYPPADILLTQKLMIEADEQKFLNTANVQPGNWWFDYQGRQYEVTLAGYYDSLPEPLRSQLTQRTRSNIGRVLEFSVEDIEGQSATQFEAVVMCNQEEFNTLRDISFSGPTPHIEAQVLERQHVLIDLGLDR